MKMDDNCAFKRFKNGEKVFKTVEWLIEAISKLSFVEFLIFLSVVLVVWIPFVYIASSIFFRLVLRPKQVKISRKLEEEFNREITTFTEFNRYYG